MKEELELTLTGDGSHTVYVPSLNEHYHSRYGAITESMHVFIHAGFNSMENRQEITVFEIGFGTGLNALLTCLEAERKKQYVNYHAIEKHPLDRKFIRRLNYATMLPGSARAGDIFLSLHRAPWERLVPVSPRFNLHKARSDFAVFQPHFNYDVVYFDAFAPEKQPEMWQTEHFRKIFGRLNPAGVLVTYCAKGQVKRNLREAGFRVEVLPGPPGKRHMLKASKSYE